VLPGGRTFFAIFLAKTKNFQENLRGNENFRENNKILRKFVVFAKIS
jgi:hypothetical protein